jgi:hypothetical protein
MIGFKGSFLGLKEAKISSRIEIFTLSHGRLCCCQLMLLPAHAAGHFNIGGYPIAVTIWRIFR